MTTAAQHKEANDARVRARHERRKEANDARAKARAQNTPAKRRAHLEATLRGLERKREQAQRELGAVWKKANELDRQIRDIQAKLVRGTS